MNDEWNWALWCVSWSAWFSFLVVLGRNDPFLMVLNAAMWGIYVTLGFHRLWDASDAR